MVLALELPASPARTLLVSTTYGVVVLSIVLQGSTMGLLLRRAGLAGPVAEVGPDGPASPRIVARTFEPRA
jgi:NhaP-type Na+/H+ or K+/H+ antiporter